jgi:chorismate mutase
MGLQDMFDEISAGHWQHADPDLCGCRGRGWLISDLDTAHWCPHHGVGVLPPEGGGDPPFADHVRNHPGLYECIRAVEMLHKILKHDPDDDPPLVVSYGAVKDVHGLLSMVLYEIEERRDKANEAARKKTREDKLNSPDPPREPELLGAWRERQDVLDAETIPEDRSLYDVWRHRRKQRLTVYGIDHEGETYVKGYLPSYYSRDVLPRMRHRLVTDDPEHPEPYYRHARIGEPGLLEEEKPTRAADAGGDIQIPF